MRHLKSIKSPLELNIVRGAICSTTPNSVVIHQPCQGKDFPKYNKKTRQYEDQITVFDRCGTVFLGYEENVVAHTDESVYINSVGYHKPSKVTVRETDLDTAVYSIPFVLLALGHSLTKPNLND